MTDQELQEEPSRRLESLSMRDTSRARNRSAVHSRFVGLFRWVLPLAVLAVLVVLVVWPMWNANKLSAVMVENVPNLMVEKLDLSGIDDQNQPYKLKADRALQAMDQRHIVDLERPEGEITLQDGAWIVGKAEQGRINQDTRRLWLGGMVELFHDNGYRFVSDEMHVDLNKSTAWGEQPVVIQGPFGQVEGAGFRLLEGGKTVIIAGPAKASVHLQDGASSDKTEGQKQ